MVKKGTRSKIKGKRINIIGKENLPIGSFLPLFELFSEEARLKMRKITLLQDTYGLPKGSYTLVENYCADKECDCRKVMINVVRIEDKPTILATIGFGWEDAEYYTKWMGGDEAIGRQMAGAYLELGGIQTDFSENCMELVRNSLRDHHYIGLIRKHYRMFKDEL